MHAADKATPIESRRQLVEYLASGCKPESEWSLGTEHEKFGFTVDDLKPLPYEGAASIRAMLSCGRHKRMKNSLSNIVRA